MGVSRACAPPRHGAHLSPHRLIPASPTSPTPLAEEEAGPATFCSRKPGAFHLPHPWATPAGHTRGPALWGKLCGTRHVIRMSHVAASGIQQSWSAALRDPGAHIAKSRTQTQRPRSACSTGQSGQWSQTPQVRSGHVTHVTGVEKTHPHLCSRPSESPWPGKSLPLLPPQKGPVRGLLI